VAFIVFSLVFGAALALSFAYPKRGRRWARLARVEVQVFCAYREPRKAKKKRFQGHTTGAGCTFFGALVLPGAGGYDGLEFVAARHADRSIAPFPVIFLTVDAATEQRARALGAAAFLTKPVPSERLPEEVARHIAPRAHIAPISAALAPVRGV
jgi:CheY-like chemotaxis protein